jgi:hypothetical protein
MISGASGAPTPAPRIGHGTSRSRGLSEQVPDFSVAGRREVLVPMAHRMERLRSPGTDDLIDLGAECGTGLGGGHRHTTARQGQDYHVVPAGITDQVSGRVAAASRRSRKGDLGEFHRAMRRLRSPWRGSAPGPRRSGSDVKEPDAPGGRPTTAGTPRRSAKRIFPDGWVPGERAAGVYVARKTRDGRWQETITPANREAKISPDGSTSERQLMGRHARGLSMMPSGVCRLVGAVPTPTCRPGPREGAVVSRGLAHPAGSDSGIFVRMSEI